MADTDDGWEGQATVSVGCCIEWRSGLWAEESSCCTPASLVCVFVILLCALVHCQLWTGQSHPQTVPTMLRARKCPKCLGLLEHEEFLSVELRGWAQLLKYTSTPWSPLLQSLHLAQCNQTCTVLLTTAKPKLVHRITRRRSDSPLQRACLHCSRLRWRHALRQHCTWMQLLGSGNLLHGAFCTLF